MKIKNIVDYLLNQKKGGVILIDSKGDKYINLNDNECCHVGKSDLLEFKTGEIIHISKFEDNELDIFIG